MRHIYAVLILVFSCSLVRSQDIHFTLYDFAPLAFNPAQTGAFYGTYRISGIYRDQWLSVAGVPDQFKTPSFSIDANLIRGFRPQDWVGVGVLFYSDKSGSLGMTNGSFKLSGAYHLGLDKKGKNVLTIGYQTGSVSRRITAAGLQKIELESDQYVTGQFTNDPAIAGQSELKKSYLDHVGGLHFRSNLDGGDLIKVGVALGHIGQPDGNLLQQGGRFRTPMRIVAHGGWRNRTSARFAIYPTFMAQFMGKASEVTLQFHTEYLLNPEKSIVLRPGLGYRIGDALQLIVGMDFNALRVTLGYDINLSKLSSASGGFGGFELSAMYIGKVFKKPDPDPILFCPRF